MKKKVMHLIAVFPLIAVSLALLNRCAMPVKPAADKPLPEISLLERAAVLMDAEADYLNARRKSDWKTVYEFQTAHYKKKIPFEEFVYFGGKRTSDWKEYAEKETTVTISGLRVPVPSIEEMRARIEDTKPAYEFVGGAFPGRVSKFEFWDQVQISSDGKHARTQVDMDVQWMTTTIWMDIFSRADYWDFEDGKWRVQLNRWDYRPISGMRKPPGPDIQYETVPLGKIIDYKLKKAGRLYFAGKKEEAGREYLGAAALRPFETYARIPMKDKAIKDLAAKAVLEKVEQWNAFLEQREMIDSMGFTLSDSWTPEKIKLKREELEKIKKDFTL
ncbi:MAG: hypothetical protein HZA01_04285 [Nitrospinae bacterium]|nr:hypothetical protein [Nitrospinota bacterium]